MIKGFKCFSGECQPLVIHLDIMLHIYLCFFLTIFYHSCLFYEIIRPFALDTTNIFSFISIIMLNGILSIPVFDKVLGISLIFPDFPDDAFRAFILKVVDADHCYFANRFILIPRFSFYAKYQISLFGEIFGPFKDCQNTRTRNLIVLFRISFPFNEYRGIDFAEMFGHVLFLEQ